MLKKEVIQEVLRPDVLEICAPLFSSTDISYFHHARIYNEGTTASLNTFPKWFECYVEEGFHEKADYFFDSGVCLLTAVPAYRNECAVFRSQFGVDHKFDITVRKNEYIDVFGFGTDAYNDSTVEFYFHNLDLLKRFTKYFLEAAQPLHAKAFLPENRITLPGFEKSFRAKKKENKHNALVFNRNFISHHTLTPKEYACLVYMQKGYASKDIAKELNISPRTVESHISRLRKRLRAYSKSQLVQDIKPLDALL